MSYGEWCPTCSAPIVSVTRGIPSIGTCENGHKIDRRDVLRREPEKPAEAKIKQLTAALSEAIARAEKAEAALVRAKVGLVQARDELDEYSRQEYLLDHPVHERYRQRDYDANPARIALSEISSEAKP